MWLNCPKQWEYAYVDKLKPVDQSIHLIFGTATHLTIQWWLEKRFENAKQASYLALDDILKEHMMAEFKKSVIVKEDGTKQLPCTKEEFQEAYDDGIQILNEVKKQAATVFPNKHIELVGCEVPLEFEVRPGVNFVAYLDIVFKHTLKNTYYILDLKTSGKGWYYEKKDFKKLAQLLLYKKFFAQEKKVPLNKINVKFIILKRKLNEKIPFLDKRVVEFEPVHENLAINNATNKWDAFVTSCYDDAGIIQSNQMATPSKSACRFCPFNSRTKICDKAEM